MMNGDLYEMELRVYEEIRKGVSPSLRARKRRMDKGNALRAGIMMGFLCLALLGMCRIKDVSAPTEHVRKTTTVSASYGN